MRSNRFLKITALLLAFCLFAACGLSPSDFGTPLPDYSNGEENSSTDLSSSEEGIEAFTLAYVEEDSLHPFRATTQANLNIVPLVYDSLVRLDSSFTPIPQLASEVAVNGQSCTISLREGLVFSDGSPLTSADVIYSLNAARAEGSYYAARLANIASITMVDEYTVLVSLSTPDIYFANNLDIPIIKSQSDSGGAMPIGCGRYILVTENVEPHLTVNERWYGETKPGYSTIHLLSMPDAETLLYSVKIGTISYIYSDLDNGDGAQIGTSSVPVVTNNLVYVGVNHGRTYLSNPTFRRAVSLALNRDQIVSKAYSSRGVPSSTPFNPSFYATMQATTQQTSSQIDAANSLLDELGYTERNSDGYRLSGGRVLSFSVLVNSEDSYKRDAANLMAEQLGSVGIQLTVVEVPFSEYTSYINNQNFDFFIGEVHLLNNMDITCLLDSTSQPSLGSSLNEALLSSYQSMRAGTISMEEFLEVFSSNTPIIPLLYRSAVVAFSRSITGNIKATIGDIFYNIEEWSNSSS